MYALLCGLCLACLWRLRTAERGPAIAGGLERRPGGVGRASLAAARGALAGVAGLRLADVAGYHESRLPGRGRGAFLWVVPLALYLLSFIVCFDHQRWYVRRLSGAGDAVGDLGCGVRDDIPNGRKSSAHRSWAASLIRVLGKARSTRSYTARASSKRSCWYFATLFLRAWSAMGNWCDCGPHPRYLTGFYLMVAAGGALGGLFVSLAAPLLFTTFLEWDIALVACYLMAVAALGLAGRPGKATSAAQPDPLPAAVVGVVYISSGSPSRPKWSTEPATSTAWLP